MTSHTILVSDKFSAKGITRLKEQTDMFSVLYEEKGFQRSSFLQSLPKAEGLILRSATKVDKEAFSYAKNLKIIIRAGVGVDNIDIMEASRRGVIVENAPGGNTISTAEQALALLFACARYTPQANFSVKNGKWEKSKFKGSELTGKTIGVVGLGRVGKEFVYRALGLRMHVIGYDPYISTDQLEHLGIELVTKDELIARSDFITVHTPLTDDTKNFINKKNLDNLKNGVVLINAARGGIYDEEALVKGLTTQKLKAVALDVFSEEPLSKDSPLRSFDNCIMTPHLGASTDDAELAVAVETVDNMIDFFKNGVAINSLNFPTINPESMEFLQPYYKGGIRVGKLLGQLAKNIESLQIKYYGEITKYKIDTISSAIQYGLLIPALGDEVNIINAPILAKERGIQMNSLSYGVSNGFSSYVQLLIRDGKQNLIELSYTSLRKEALIFSMFGLPLEFKPKDVLLSIKNRDVPGVVGTIGTFLGKEGVNIAHLELSRNTKGEDAYCIISIDELLKESTLEDLQKLDNIIHANQIDLHETK